jgi:hypothetical protein
MEQLMRAFAQQIIRLVAGHVHQGLVADHCLSGCVEAAHPSTIAFRIY